MIYILSRNDSIYKILSTKLDKDIKLITSLGKLKESVKKDDFIIIDLTGFKAEIFKKVSADFMAVSANPTYEEAVAVLGKGIRGYGNKNMLADNYIQAFKAVQSGQIWLPPSILAKLITSVNPGNQQPKEKPEEIKDLLTKRELEVVRLVCLGKTNKEISEDLYISLRTVKAHLTSIFSKTGFRDRLELGIKMKDSFEKTLEIF